MTTQMKLFTEGDFESMYARLRSEDGMMAVLSRMQASYGIHERKAYENAEAMICLVAAHENAANMLSDDALEVLDAFLNKSDFMGGYDRKVLLHQLYFGLKLYQDEELIEKIKEGAAEHILFHEYYTRCGEDPAITEAMLEEEIRKMMGNYRISPKIMRHIVKQMEQSQNLRATAAELGEDGMRFKAIAAMDLYLRNRDTMTMEEAAHIACTNVELQAMADGVSQGLITEERAKKIFAVICLLTILAAIALAFYAPQISAEIAKIVPDAAHCIDTLALEGYSEKVFLEGTANRIVLGKTRLNNVVTAKQGLLLGGLAFATVSDDIAKWMGQFAAKRTFVRSAKEADTAAAMENMITRMENETAESVAAETQTQEEQTEVRKQVARAYT